MQALELRKQLLATAWFENHINPMYETYFWWEGALHDEYTGDFIHEELVVVGEAVCEAVSRGLQHQQVLDTLQEDIQVLLQVGSDRKVRRVY